MRQQIEDRLKELQEWVAFNRGCKTDLYRGMIYKVDQEITFLTQLLNNNPED